MDALTQGAIFLAIAGLWSVFVAKVLGPWAWARAVDNPKSKASKVLMRVLSETRAAIVADVKAAFPGLPDTKAMEAKVEALAAGFNAMVPLINNLTGENLSALMKQAYKEMRQGEILRGDLPPGDLTPAQQAELEGLRRDPDGKVQLVSAENAIDAAVNMKLLKEGTGKALKKQLNSAFASGQPIEAVLEPYKALLDRFLGGAAPSVRLTGGGGGGRAGTGGHY